MRTGYLVDKIVHSGRKAPRYTPCFNEKYRGLHGYLVAFDPDKIQQGKSLHMTVVNSPEYEWWDTTMVIASVLSSDENELIIETVNTIYILKKADNQKQCVNVKDNKPYTRNHVAKPKEIEEL